MVEAGFWGLLAASPLVFGALLARRVASSTSRVGRIMAFGAGALVAALAYELVPDMYIADVQIWLSFGVGALAFYGLDNIVERRLPAVAGPGAAIAFGALLDGVPESMVLGIGMAVGGSVSIGFLVAVIVSNLPESLCATVELHASRDTGWILRLWSSITVISGFAAALGYFVASRLDGVDGRYVQALAAGAVLTMLSDSMMPEAVAKGGKPVALLTTLGFAVAAVLTTVG
jgi:ZIP family zinc transporter